MNNLQNDVKILIISIDDFDKREQVLQHHNKVLKAEQESVIGAKGRFQKLERA